MKAVASLRSDAGENERVETLARGVLNHDRALLARAITLIESRHPVDRADAAQLLRLLLPHTGGACRVGISGPPGAGKSTLIEALGCAFIASGRKVAVLAIDPSSEDGGGSILADKTRMEQLAAEAHAFIRPSPSSGASGGVARGSYEAMLLCEAAGFDVVFIETVGVGQLESAVADMVDIFALLALPGAGDELQGMKKGSLERADMIWVGKADGEREVEARAAMSRYQEAMGILGTLTSRPAVEISLCSAVSGLGIESLRDSIDAAFARLKDSGALESKRGEQRVRRMKTMLESEVMEMFLRDEEMRSWLQECESALRAGETTPFLVIDDIIARLEKKLKGATL